MRLYLALALGAVLATAGAGFGGYRHGLKVARAECQAEQQAARAAAEVQAESHRLAARAAAAEFERQRRELEVSHARTSTALRQALQRPISCPAGPLAAVPVPAAVVDGLRDAGADPADPPGPPAAGPVRPLLVRP